MISTSPISNSKSNIGSSSRETSKMIVQLNYKSSTVFYFSSKAMLFNPLLFILQFYCSNFSLVFFSFYVCVTKISSTNWNSSVAFLMPTLANCFRQFLLKFAVTLSRKLVHVLFYPSLLISYGFMAVTLCSKLQNIVEQAMKTFILKVIYLRIYFKGNFKKSYFDDTAACLFAFHYLMSGLDFLSIILSILM